MALLRRHSLVPLQSLDWVYGRKLVEDVKKQQNVSPAQVGLQIHHGDGVYKRFG